MNLRQKVRKGIILFSFFLFPAIFYYFSPVLIIFATKQGIINGSFILFLLMFLSALLLGRAWCGWVCPGAGCQEALFLVNDKKITRGSWIKWVIWLPWISAIIFFAIQAGGYHKIDFLFQTTYGFSVASLHAVIVYFMVLLLLIVFPSYFFGKRAFCHYLCWMAPFMILGRKIRNQFHWTSLHLAVDSKKCKECQRCVTNCPMSLPVAKMVKQNKMENKECILCGTCVDVCRSKAIKLVIPGCSKKEC